MESRRAYTFRQYSTL